MHSTTLVLFSLLSSALGFLVTSPSLTHGWTNQGSQTVEWQRVSTDAQNFSIVLTSLNRQQLPSDLVLVSFVNAVSANSISVPPPSGEWPSPGGSYRINLVASSTQTTTIYAQSSEFNITAGAATATGPGTGTGTTTVAPGTGSKATTITGTGTGTAQGAASTDDFNAPSFNGASKQLPLAAGSFACAVALVSSMLLYILE